LLRLPQRWADLTNRSAWRALDPQTVNTARRIVAAIGAPLAIGVGMYTGVLLGAIPARPLWNTPMVAQLFLMSAMSSGVATVLLIASLSRSHHLHTERHFLVSFDAMLIFVEILMIVPFFLHQSLSTWSASGSLELIMGGPFTLAFWVGVVLLGLLIPLAIEGFELFPVIWQEQAIKYSRLWGGLSAGLVLIGSFALRYVFVYAGQVSHFLPQYVR
jgi:formate-dependent nitrite reductase membrane component NrfD